MLGRRAQESAKILVDVGLSLDLAPSAARDDFRLTVDYGGVEQAVREAVETGERQLVETLAEQVAAVVLKRQKRVLSVRVLIHKTPAVMPRTREVVVDIVRPARG